MENDSSPIPPQTGNVDRVYSVNIDGSNLKYLSYADDFITSFTGDTVFIRSNDSIYASDLDGTKKHLLTPLLFYNFWLSSGGNKICLEQAHTSDRYFINTDGSGLIKINFPVTKINSWDLSPAADKVVYSCNTGLYLINLDGSSQRLLDVASDSSFITNVHFTPDGNAVIYFHGNFMNEQESFIKCNLQDGTITKLFNDLGNFELSALDKILFTSLKGIYLFDLKTNSNELLTYGRMAHFSPDGSRFSYLDNNVMFVYNLTSVITTTFTNVVNKGLPGHYVLNSHLSSDNNRIVFQTDSSYNLPPK